ncbi:MAG: fatty acid desaturase [Pseudomonadota bacterium]
MDQFVEFFMTYLYGGLLDLGPWGYVLASFIMLQISMMAVTLYLHRDQAHRSLDLHPALRHFFRFWIWCTSGMLTREWVAVHRKHHAFCETEDDPHSPQIYGLKKVLLEGAELYRDEKNNRETVEKYGRGTPDDWLERNVYEKVPYGGIILLVLADLFFFGVPGIILIAVQLVSMPLFAAGIINGVGHHTGYRNFECDDAARNLVPWGLLVGGEELHNNHHAFPTSAKFSMRPWEFDIGWMYITIFKTFGLAKVKKVAPQPERDVPATEIGLEQVRAIIVNRMHVLRDYTREVTLPTLDIEKTKGAEWLRKARKVLVRQPALLDAKARHRLDQILENSSALRTVHEFRDRLQLLWKNSTAISNERLVEQLKQWCEEAEASGIRVLQDFSDRVRGYAMSAQPARA